MRCQRCQFENMPGQVRCMRCGSVLTSDLKPVDVHPPRMAPWERPWRDLARTVRGLRSRLGPDRAHRRTTHPPPERIGPLLGFMVMAAIPGLGHLVTGRLRRIWVFWVGWLACVGIAIYCFKAPPSWPLLGLAVALHAWMAADSLGMGSVKDVRERFTGLLVAMGLVALGYAGVAGLAMRDLWIQPTPLAVPYYPIQVGDHLLLRRIPESTGAIERGMMVRYVPGEVGIGRDQGYRRTGILTWTIGEIVGLPGETVVVKQGRFCVNGLALDQSQFPVPQWLIGDTSSVRLGAGQYFVSTQYRGYAPRGQGRMDVCAVDRPAIQAQATRIWWPLSRRRALP